MSLASVGRYDEALEQYQKGLALIPDFPPSNGLLVTLYLKRGMNQEVLAQARKVESLLVGAGSPSYMGGLGHLYGTVGQRTEALYILNELKKRADKEYVPASALAHIYIGLWERKTALDLLEKA